VQDHDQSVCCRQSCNPKPVAPESPGARRLIALSDEHLRSLYPPEFCFLESVEALQKSDVRFLGIEDNGTLVACGAVKLMQHEPAYGEIKRLFVLASQRGKGHGRSLMLALESELRSNGIALARLETGIWQPEALALYEAFGYRRRGPFGAYPDNPYSVFMEKVLAPGT
jgi:putative acetyltransferase